jgi:hypothetical protein
LGRRSAPASRFDIFLSRRTAIVADFTFDTAGAGSKTM